MGDQINTYCSYYQANVNPPDAWFLVSILKSFENVAMDRTLDPKKSLFEFFVPETNEDIFLYVMKYFEQEGIVTNLQKVPNRLINNHHV